MMFSSDSFANLYLMAALINLVAALMNWFRYPVSKEIRRLSIILFLTTLWLMGGYIECAFAQISLEARFWIILLENTISGLMILLLFFFVLDHFHLWPWFTGAWRKSLWGLLFFHIALGWTNPLHHLIWTAETNPVPGTNIVLFEHGPLFWFSNAFGIAIILLTLSLLSYKVIGMKKGARREVLLQALALAYPFLSYLTFVLLPDPVLGIALMPFGYAFVGIFITWIMFDHMHNLIRQQTLALQEHVASLTQEIKNREKLEQKLRESQERLASRLEEQNDNMARFYNFLLIDSDVKMFSELLERLLAKTKEIVACTALCFFRQESGQLLLEASSGLDKGDPISFRVLSASGIAVEDAVNTVSDTSVDKKIPLEFAEQGYHSAQIKRVIVRDRVVGVLAALWKEEKQFSVEEISLFNGISSGMGLILENSRLRRMAADRAKSQERRRLARNLHDSVSRSLHNLASYAETAGVQARSDRQNLGKTLNYLEVGARQALKEMRLLLYELHRGAPNETNLVDGICHRLDVVEQRAGIEVNFSVSEGFYLLRAYEVELYPLVTEILNNSLKHAHARRLDVAFTREDEEFAIIIADDGVGFQLEEVKAIGTGLRMIEERCQQLGASLTIATGTGKGTRICVRIPAVRDQNILEEK